MKTTNVDVIPHSFRKRLKESEDRIAVANLELLRIKDQYHNLFNNLTDEVHLWKLIFNKNGTIKTWKLIDINPIALNSWGMTKSEILGKTTEEIFGKDAIALFKPIVKQIFKTGKPHKWITYFRPTNQYLSMVSVPMGDFFISTGKDISHEIEEQKKHEANTDLLGRAERISNQGSWKWDIQNNIWTFSENWMQIHGFENAEITKNDFIQILHPDDRGLLITILNESLRKKKSFSIEVRVVKNDTKDLRWMKITTDIHLETSEEPAYIIGVTKDITTEKISDEELLEGPEFLKTIGEIAKVGGWQLKGNFKTLYLTEVAGKLLDMPYAYYPSLKQTINLFSSEFRSLAQKEFREAIRTGKKINFNARVQTKHGKNIWIKIIGKPEMNYGRCIRISGTIQDISGQKKAEQKLHESEQKFRSIFKDSAVAKILADDKGNYLNINNKICEILGYNRKEMKALSMDGIIFKDTKKAKDLFNSFKNNKKEHGELMVRRKDGQIRIIEYYIKKIGENRQLSTLFDITEKRKTEVEKEKTQLQLQHVTNSVPGAIYQFIFHNDGRISLPFLSERATELLGVELEMMKNPELLFSRIHPEDATVVLNSIMSANKHNALWHQTFRVLDGDNKIVWIEGHSLGCANSENDIIHNGVLLDVTKQKDTEGALKLSLIQYNNIADNLPGVVFKYKLNPDGSDEMLYMSKGCAELFEIKAEKAVENVHLIWEKIHEEDVADIMPSVLKSAEDLSIWEYEYRIKFKDGREKWVSLRGVPEKQSDGSVIWDTIGIDVTKRKKAEEQLAQINNNLEKMVEERAQKAIKLSKELETYWLAAEHSKSGVWYFNVIKDELRWDKIMYELYGVEQDDFSGAYEAWETSVHPEDIEKTAMALQETIIEKKDFDTIFRIIHQKSGEIRHIRGKGKVELDAEGNTMAVFGTNWDVTEEIKLVDERQRVLSQLNETQTQLIRAEKMASLGVLTAGVAHELNNPLNYIIGGYTFINDHLKEGNEICKDEIKESLSWIKTGADRATDIVKGLNLFSRTNKNYTEDCDLHLIINDCLLMLRNKYQGKAKIIRKFTDENLIIKGNVGKLHQAILNILSNAVDAVVDKGEVQIITKSQKDLYQIIIIDNGCGIPKELINKVLDPFYTSKPPGKGTGLGLSITHSIIQEHKGDLKLESNLDIGTKVYISLPKRDKYGW